jgi:hypothetical protein
MIEDWLKLEIRFAMRVHTLVAKVTSGTLHPDH